MQASFKYQDILFSVCIVTIQWFNKSSRFMQYEVLLKCICALEFKKRCLLAINGNKRLKKNFQFDSYLQHPFHRNQLQYLQSPLLCTQNKHLTYTSHTADEFVCFWEWGNWKGTCYRILRVWPLRTGVTLISHLTLRLIHCCAIAHFTQHLSRRSCFALSNSRSQLRERKCSYGH